MARVRLGMTVDEFMDVTPRYLALLFEEDAQARKHDGALGEYMLAQLTALVANFGRGENCEPAKAKDFMPSEWGKAPKRKSRKQQMQEVEADREVWKELARRAGKFIPAAKVIGSTA